LIAFFILWVRGRFPRIRYDRLMALTWKRFLPFRLFFIYYSNFLRWVI
jgi:NADH:ubiquinone oxidoreductase subunit H